MLKGLVMSDFPLTIQHILHRMRRETSAAEVVSLRPDGTTTRATYGECAARIDRLSAGLATLGVTPGDRVGTFAWNSQEHFEAYVAVPCMGAVLHTINLRLFPEQIVYIVNHAEDKVIFVEDSLVPALEAVLEQFQTVEHFVLIGEGSAGSLPNVVRYEDLLDAGSEPFVYPELDEGQAAGLCYTSGTTGNPKGVLYSHRSNVLHSLAECLHDALDIRAGDRVLPVVPMFHANAWGLPYSCALVGASLVMPNRFLTAEPIARLIQEEQVTIAGAVPTIWMDLLRYADEHQPDFSSLRVVPCGGAAVPRELMEGFETRHGVRIVQCWGMTEMSPLGSCAREPAGVTGPEKWDYRTTAGKVVPLVEARIIDDDGNELPWDGIVTGELQVRGPWVASAYYEHDTDEQFDRGWLRTGDVAALTPAGYIRITDRAKDVIKSGGEWISSVDLENEIMGHPDVLEAAVIRMPDERWTERPLACVVARPGASLSARDLREHLFPRVAKFWVPDAYAFIDEVPKTSVGKFDKKVLRARLEDGALEISAAADAAGTGV